MFDVVSVSGLLCVYHYRITGILILEICIDTGC
jgi:hypothetical protein